MAEATHSEIQIDLASETEAAQQMVELKPPLLSSHHQHHHYCHQQQQLVEDDEATIDMIEMNQDCGDGLLLPECCIYRVPFTLRHLKEEAYTPSVVSVGPFHYGNERLQDMQRHKKVMFKRFTQKAGSSWDDLFSFVKHLVPKVRASYSETINLTEHQLAKLTLLDAGFIIQLFIMDSVTNDVDNDAKLSQPWLEDSIRYDLILLENQLPFFVIEELFNRAFPLHQIHDDDGNHFSFLELTYVYFGHYNTQKFKADPKVKIKHFTDLLRLFYGKGEKSPMLYFSEEVQRNILLYNVNALQEAGIKVKVSDSKCLLDLKFTRHTLVKANESKCLLDLKFTGDTLEIPKIQVDRYTELLRGNMIALEQCHYPYDGYIADYALLLDWLIDTSKDVDLLIHNKIVKNYFGDTNSVALLFNSLSEPVIHSTFSSEYLDTCKGLNGYCQNRWHKMKATLRRDYCRTPWQIVASIAAIVLLFLTVVQTIFSILQVVK